MSFMKKIKDANPIEVNIDPEKVEAMKAKAAQAANASKTKASSTAEDAKVLGRFVSDNVEAKAPAYKAKATEQGSKTLNGIRAKAHNVAQAAANKLDNKEA